MYPPLPKAKKRSRVPRSSMGRMRRVVVLGRGAAGKSSLATRLGDITGLPVIELDRLFWQPGLAPLPVESWTRLQRQLAGREAWIMDGDLGPHDALEVRLRPADTVVVLDFPLVRCAWRALRRSRERLDFWVWLVGYRRRSLPLVERAIAEHASGAAVHVLRSPGAVRTFLAAVASQSSQQRGRNAG